ncbi:MAG: DUF4430 domain-containing protein [Candidatus Odinarchaeia archaeon]
MSVNKGYAMAVLLLFTSIGLASTTVFFYVQSENYRNAYESYATNSVFINIGINYGNGTISWYNNTLAPKNTTALSATILVAIVNYTIHPVYGAYVTGINGVEGDSNHYWAFYINGEYASVGASSYIVLNGDTITWVYTEF